MDKTILCGMCKKFTPVNLIFCVNCGSIFNKDPHIPLHEIVYALDELHRKIQKTWKLFEFSINSPLYNFGVILETNVIITTFFIEKHDKQNKEFKNYLSIKYLEQPKQTIDFILLYFSTRHQMLSVMFDWLFAFENYFSNIINDSLKKSPSSRYSVNVKTIVNYFMSKSSDKTKNECIDGLYFPYIVRNTFHNNQKSNHDADAKIGQYIFRLYKNKVSHVSTWAHLIHYMNGMIDVLPVVFENADFFKKP